MFLSGVRLLANEFSCISYGDTIISFSFFSDYAVFQYCVCLEAIVWLTYRHESKQLSINYRAKIIKLYNTHPIFNTHDGNAFFEESRKIKARYSGVNEIAGLFL